MNTTKIQEVKEAICEVGKRMYAKEMCASNDGNISVKVEEGVYVCTPTGVSKASLKPEMMMVCNLKGELLEENLKGYKLTSEFKLHARIYELREDVNAVTHAHPLYATAFACARMPLDQDINTEMTIMLGSVPMVKYGLPGTEKIYAGIEEFTPYHNAVLMEAHGAVSYGKDLESAFLTLESVEFCAKMTSIAMNLGPLVPFKKEEMDEINELSRKIHTDGVHRAFKK